MHSVAFALQHSPEQVAPLPAVHVAASALGVQSVLTPPVNTAARAKAKTALSSILLIEKGLFAV